MKTDLFFNCKPPEEKKHHYSELSQVFKPHPKIETIIWKIH